MHQAGCAAKIRQSGADASCDASSELWELDTTRRMLVCMRRPVWGRAPWIDWARGATRGRARQRAHRRSQTGAGTNERSVTGAFTQDPFRMFRFRQNPYVQSCAHPYTHLKKKESHAHARRRRGQPPYCNGTTPPPSATTAAAAARSARRAVSTNAAHSPADAPSSILLTSPSYVAP